MAYQCRQCELINGEVGACPVCNIPMDIKLQDEETNKENGGMQPDMPPAEDVTPGAAPAPDAPAPVVDPMATPAEEDEDEDEVPAEGGEQAV